MIIPEKLKRGDEVRIIAPSRSLNIISEECRNNANKVFESLGLKLSFSKNIEKCDEFFSSSIKDRIEDLHEAFLDKNVKAIFTVIGGYNSNQLLKYIDYEIVRNNPKIFCGYSDITALSCAIYHKTGLINYSGPVYSTFGMEKGLDYTIEYMKKALMENSEFEVKQSETWSDDLWYINQKDRNVISNEGFNYINEGEADGKIIGGNLCTLNLLQGTEFMPSLENVILFIEDADLTFAEIFDRDLQSLIHQKDFDKVKGIVFGRFQVKSNISEETFRKIITSKKELRNIPIIFNINFGHTTPHITFPIGGFAKIVAGADIRITIK